jgi:diketogulonate reductase-like aldo/keto reductase
MPALGLAAFRSDDVAGTKAMLNRCIKRGIRHIEIADLFSNGSIVAECIGEHQIPREEFFITFKVHEVICSDTI